MERFTSELAEAMPDILPTLPLNSRHFSFVLPLFEV
jgi:hypothetical protein